MIDQGSVILVIQAKHHQLIQWHTSTGHIVPDSIPRRRNAQPRLSLRRSCRSQSFPHPQFVPIRRNHDTARFWQAPATIRIESVTQGTTSRAARACPSVSAWTESPRALDPVAVGPPVGVIDHPVRRFGPQPGKGAQLLGAVRAQTATRAPSAASTMATARPMPRPAPVTKAVEPERVIVLLS